MKILCWAMTTPSQHEKNAKHVKATWGKRCDILYFVSTGVNFINVSSAAFTLVDPEIVKILTSHFLRIWDLCA